MLSLKDFESSSIKKTNSLVGGQDYIVTGRSVAYGNTWEDWSWSDGTYACDVYVGKD